jgi:beta-lactamase class A
MTLDRRSMIAGAAALAGMACVPLDRSADGRLLAALRIIERALGGRLGVAFHAPAYRASLAYNGDERFPMCSTFKTSLAALALSLEQDGTLDLSERVTWTADDLIFHTPFTGERVAQGATLRELAHAAQTVSDNLAANLLLDRVGGPAGLTAFWRRLGDETSRLDRMETAVNFVPEGDVRDTTTPVAMARTLAKMLATNSESPLEAPRRRELRRWMIESTTGLKRVRAGLPENWVAGDKTGNSGAHPAMGYLRGNIGFALDPSEAPTFFAVYHQSPVGAPIDGQRVDATFAQVGRLLADWAKNHEAP